MDADALLKIQLSYARIRSGLENYQAEWRSWRPILDKYLPQDKVHINKVDHQFDELWHYLEQASQAEERGQKWRATSWLVHVKLTRREIAKSVEDIGERGLQAQEQARKKYDATA